jgi:hypothetical protein
MGYQSKTKVNINQDIPRSMSVVLRTFVENYQFDPIL